MPPHSAVDQGEALLRRYVYTVQDDAWWYRAKLSGCKEGRAILEATPEVQIGIIRAGLQITWNFHPQRAISDALLSKLARRRLPYRADDVTFVLDHPWSNLVLARGVLRALKEDAALMRACLPALSRLEGEIENWPDDVRDNRDYKDKITHLLTEVRGEALSEQPPVYADWWGEWALSEWAALAPEVQGGWLETLRLCGRANASKPGKRWSKQLTKCIGTLGNARFAALTTGWLGHFASRANDAELDERNVTLLKGLAWACAPLDDERAARTLGDVAIRAYRQHYRKLGNACLCALEEQPMLQSVPQLQRVRTKVKYGPVREDITWKLRWIARENSLHEAELDELAIPTFGLKVGRLTASFGEVAAHLEIRGREVHVSWGDARRASVPTSVMRDFGAALEGFKRRRKEIADALSVQRHRLERLFLSPRTWPYRIWRERYLDHPLVSPLARRLIWRFEEGEQARSGIWHKDRLTDALGQTLTPPDTATVRLWHPVGSTVQEVQTWRTCPFAHGVTQPFKQAHREVYLITDAERETRTASNRFAAHILRQHQFHGLCRDRGWEYQLRLAESDTNLLPAGLTVPEWNLSAELQVEALEGAYGVRGTYLHIVTDKVRFRANYRGVKLPEPGGGYRSYREGTLLPLDRLEPVVFSEVMRDVDLFVSVTSVGNDPTWSDCAPDRHFREYWHDYALGALSSSAQLRAESLSQLLPRLQIAGRCKVEGRFLFVRGTLRSYKIHLGSGNVLTVPNNHHLCILPKERPTSAFLPFEGDEMLSIILSKAFMLASDATITDPVIMQQIKA